MGANCKGAAKWQEVVCRVTDYVFYLVELME